MAVEIFFYIFAILALIGAIASICARNTVRAVLSLVFTFVCTAAIWMLLEAEFLSLVLIVVYVGAVMVLFLFVVMMLNINLESRGEERKSLTLVGSGIVFLTLVGLSMFIPYSGGVPAPVNEF